MEAPHKDEMLGVSHPVLLFVGYMLGMKILPSYLGIIVNHYKESY